MSALQIKIDFLLSLTIILSMAFHKVWVHESFTMERSSQRRLDSLSSGQIDHAFHYQSLHQGKLWLEVFKKYSPVATASQVADLYQQLSHSIARSFSGKSVHVISLGCGDGRKDLRLVRSLVEADALIRWTPQDINLSLLLLATQSASNLPLNSIHPVIADLQAIPSLREAFDPIDPHTPRIYTFYGLVPNFDPDFLLSCWSTLLRPQDHLLVSANLSPVTDESKSAYLEATQAIQSQYDNPETQNWLSTVLKDWGIYNRLQNYRVRTESRHELLRFVAAMEWREEIHFPWENQELLLKKGDNLRLFFSYRYTPARFRKLAERSRLKPLGEFISESKDEGVWWLARLDGP